MPASNPIISDPERFTENVPHGNLSGLAAPEIHEVIIYRNSVPTAPPMHNMRNFIIRSEGFSSNVTQLF